MINKPSTSKNDRNRSLIPKLKVILVKLLLKV